jgi:hypothetical protein
MRAAVCIADRTGHVNHPVDQLRPGCGRHCLVQRVERGLVESLPFDK